MSNEHKRDSRILLVDDDHDVLGAYARFLRLNALDVTLADHPERGLHLASETQFDLVVTDLRMPHMSGLQFADALRQTQPLLPILFLSGFAVLSDVVSAMRLGAVDFLEKPVEPDTLLERINTILAPLERAASLQRLAFDVSDLDVPFKARVQAYERYLIEHALISCDGRVAETLEKLQINRRTLNDKMSKLGISRHRIRSGE